MLRRVLQTTLIAASLAASPLVASSALAQGASPLAQLTGSWRGSGTVRFEGGQSERLSCRGYYTAKDGGTGLGLALRCASSSGKIELRSLLHYKAGRVTGSWEERSFNASGGVSGRASSGTMSVAISGGGFSGVMSISFSGSRQSVSINTSGTGFKGVSISLKRG